MAEKYSFFDAELVNGVYDRSYLSEDFSAYFANFIGNGVYAADTNALKVSSYDGMTVQLSAGNAFINGRAYQNTTVKELKVSSTDGILARIDRVVIRLSLTNRTIEAIVIEGTPAMSPSAPALTRTSSVYDLCVAEIYVGATATEILQSNITDTRFDSDLCGTVAGIVQQIDTTGLFSQYTAQFNEWFDTVKGQLGEDAATAIQAQIQDITDEISDLPHIRRQFREEANFIGDVNIDSNLQVDGKTFLNGEVGFNGSVRFNVVPEFKKGFSTTASNVYGDVNCVNGVLYAKKDTNTSVGRYFSSQTSGGVDYTSLDLYNGSILNSLALYSNGNAIFSKNLSVSGTLSVTGSSTFTGAAIFNNSVTMNSSLTTKGGIEVYGATPYIDFHFNNSSADYTSRIIEKETGVLYVEGRLKCDASHTDYSTSRFRNIHAGTGDMVAGTTGLASGDIYLCYA